MTNPRSAPPIATGEIPLLTPSFVYLVYGAGDECLYVGVTDNLFMRLNNHRTSGARWIYEAQRMAWEAYPSRAAAEFAETCAIQRLRPKYNIRKNDELLAARRMGHQQLYPQDAWERLAETIRARRAVMQRSQRSIAADARLPVADLRRLEAGRDNRHDGRALQAVENALDWQPGSVEAVLAGDDPTPMSDEDIQARALAAYKRFAAKAG